MAYQKSELYFLFALLAGASVLAFFIFAPFLNALFLAVIFATAFAPVHKRILSVVRMSLRSGRVHRHSSGDMPASSGLSAALATAFVLIVLVVPVTFVSMQILREATALYATLVTNGGATGLTRVGEAIARNMGITLISSDALDIGAYLKQILGFLIGHLGTVFSNVAKMAVDIFVLLIALYYLFKEGHTLKRSVIALSPLQDVYDESIFRKLELAINSVLRGSIAVGLVQGVLTAIGLTIFGVPNPVLWGSVAAIAALIPGIGTSLVLIPCILFLFFTGAQTASLGLFIWWVVAVSLVDNVLGPKLVGRGAKLHPFLILLSVLGGVSFFGPLGFLFGPLSLSLLFAFLEVYSSIRKERISQ